MMFGLLLWVGLRKVVYRVGVKFSVRNVEKFIVMVMVSVNCL